MKCARDQTVKDVAQQAGEQQPLEELDSMKENRRKKNRRSAETRNRDSVGSVPPNSAQDGIGFLHEAAIIGAIPLDPSSTVTA